jgi:hypothetical protein
MKDDQPQKPGFFKLDAAWAAFRGFSFHMADAER